MGEYHPLKINQLEDRLYSSIDKLCLKLESASEDKMLAEFLKKREYQGLKGTIERLMKILEKLNCDIREYQNKYYEVISDAEEKVYSNDIIQRIAEVRGKNY